MPISKITFLGTGRGNASDRFLRGGGGFVLQADEYQFHIDPGPGALLSALSYGINPRQNTAVLVTHGHVQHCNDLNILLASMSHHGLDTTGVLITAKSVIEGTQNVQALLTKHHQKYVEKTIIAEPERRIGIENTEIRILKAFHSDETAVGFKFYTPRFILSYSGDTTYHKDLIAQYEGSDILVLNTPTDEHDKNNLTMEDASKIIQKVQPKLVILTHFDTKMLKNDPLLGSRQLQRETGVQVITAKDGLQLDPASYSANIKQKTLNLY